MCKGVDGPNAQIPREKIAIMKIMRTWAQLRVLILLLLASSAGLVGAWAQAQETKSVVKFDPALDELISPDAKLILIKDGFGVTEGPNWVQTGKTGYIVFTDIAANVIYKMTPDGKATVLVDHAGYRGFDPWNVATFTTNRREPSDPLYRQYLDIGADGLTLDKQGNIISATLSGRSIEKIDKHGKRTIVVDHYEGKRLGGPNDVVVTKDGSIYFTDTTGGVRGRGQDPKEELPPQGVYRFKDGKLTLIVSDIATPNGLAFSPDEKYLYANTGRVNIIRKYDVQPDGTVKNGRVLIDLTVDKTPGVSDGMRVDAKGNLWSSGPGGVWIISPEGKHLGTVLFPGGPYITSTNMTFGDSDRKTLYVAARSNIFKIRTLVPGNHIF